MSTEKLCPGREPDVDKAPARKVRFRRWFAALFGGAALLLVLDHGLARPEIDRFDPVKMGDTEAAMWRSYYDGRWVSLGWKMLGLAHAQYGFSWWDSARLSWHAARAALFFRRDTNDPRCLPALCRHYAIVRKASPHSFDPDQVARLELQWWRERRRSPGPKVYGATMAAQTAIIYSISPAESEAAAMLRASMMDYRDQRRHGKMTESDWQTVAATLREAHRHVSQALRQRGSGNDWER